MKKTIALVIVLAALKFSLQAQTSNPEQQANIISQRMKDSLNLTENQRTEIYNINLPLANQEKSIRKQFAGSSSLNYYLKEMEATRDSLYRAILPFEKYQLYKLKKVGIINN